MWKYCNELIWFIDDIILSVIYWLYNSVIYWKCKVVEIDGHIYMMPSVLMKLLSEIIVLWDMYQHFARTFCFCWFPAWHISQPQRWKLHVNWKWQVLFEMVRAGISLLYWQHRLLDKMLLCSTRPPAWGYQLLSVARNICKSNDSSVPLSDDDTQNMCMHSMKYGTQVA
jgi:hypothetical protein